MNIYMHKIIYVIIVAGRLRSLRFAIFYFRFFLLFSSVVGFGFSIFVFSVFHLVCVSPSLAVFHIAFISGSGGVCVYIRWTEFAAAVVVAAACCLMSETKRGSDNRCGRALVNLYKCELIVMLKNSFGCNAYCTVLRAVLVPRFSTALFISGAGVPFALAGRSIHNSWLIFCSAYDDNKQPETANTRATKKMVCLF